METPYRWLDAFASGLTYRLARMYAPERAMTLKADAVEAWNVAAYEDQEDVSISIMPELAEYFR